MDTITRANLRKLMVITEAVKTFTTTFQAEKYPTIDKVLKKLEDMILFDLNPNVPESDPRYFHEDGKV